MRILEAIFNALASVSVAVVWKGGSLDTQSGERGLGRYCRMCLGSVWAEGFSSR